ncbi:MAG: SpoIIE family protein phosphatase, partial [Candidatus Neomarinimicrobiota bacterium]
GGDFYDFFFIDDDYFCFLVGDVSGKGVPAALFMAVTKTLLKSKTIAKSRITSEISPGGILSNINDDLSTDNPTSMFVTICLCIINLKTGVLHYSNGGHNPPYVIKSNGQLIKMDKRHGLVVGAMGGIEFKEDKIGLSLNDRVFLYTDGVTEALDKNDSLFSEGRLEKFLVSKKFESVDEVTLGAIDDVKKFEGGTGQADDITILSFEYLKKLKIDKKSWHLKIINNLSEIEGLINSFNEFAIQNKMSEKDMAQIDITLDDLSNNIISYGFEDKNTHDINFNGELSGNRLIINIDDEGKEFNLLNLEEPSTTQTVEEREIGGLGIHLVKSIMDEVKYKRSKGANKITIIKVVKFNSSENK